MRVLSWNLFHGRSVPPSGRSLLSEFEGALAGWEWDVALLQEVPPWWPPLLAHTARAEQRGARTSRNGLLWVRRAVAERWPDVIKSNGGGANAILSRGSFAEYRSMLLRSWPERRVAQLARLGGGTCVVNYHASTRVPLAEEELARLWGEARAWARGAPLVLGGDLNLREPAAPDAEAAHVARRDVDHIFALGLNAVGEAVVLGRDARVGGRTVELSDHPPLLVELRA